MIYILFFTVHECLFCSRTFDCAIAKDDHILQHFAQEICLDCNQHLIRIGGCMYTKHNEMTCIKSEIKLEPNESTQIENQLENSMSNHSKIVSIEIVEQIGDTSTIEIYNECNTLDNNVDVCDSEIKSELLIEDDKCPNFLSNLYEEQINNGNCRSIRKRKSVNEYSKCDVCGKTMLTSSLYYHIKNIHNLLANMEEFKCEPCRKNFKTADILRKHMRMKHDPTVKKLRCTLCRLIFMKESSLRNHHCKRKFGEMEKVTPMPCDECGKLLSNQNSLRKHKTLLHSRPGTIFCRVCGRLFKNLDDRDKHHSECYQRHKIRNAEFFRASQIRRKNKKIQENVQCTPVENNQSSSDQLLSNNPDTNRKRKTNSDHTECKICGKLLLIASLYNHMKNIHQTHGLNSIQFKCDKCKIEFKSQENHRKHMRMKHDSNIEKFKCELCSRIFVKKSSLGTHNCRRKTGRFIINIPMPCEICGRILSSKGTLQKHQILLHSSPDIIFCNVCGRKFSNADDRNAHRDECALKTQIRKSKAFGELGCFVCNTMFKSNQLLRCHIEMKHTDLQTFECNLCQTIFMKEFSLRAHICKPKRTNCVTCDICGKDLATRRSLRVHKILVHSPPGLIFCNLCGKKSDSIEERDAHRNECALKRKLLNTKRKLTRLECDVCKAVFKDKSRIRHHMLQVHNINKSEDKIKSLRKNCI